MTRLSTPPPCPRATTRPASPPAIILQLASLLLGLFLALPGPVDAAGQDLSEARVRLEALTQSLAGLNEAYEHASPHARERALEDLLDVAAERRATLAALLEDDPGAVLNVALPEEVRAAMPAQVQAYLERRLQLDGELEVFYEDHRDGSARLLHFLKTQDERVSLHFHAQPPGLLSGTHVSAAGVLLDDDMVLESGGSILTLAARGGSKGGSNGGAPAPSPSVLGAQSILLILVNFADDTLEPYSVADAQATLFGTTSSYFRENSQDQTWLSGDAAGWFTIPLSSGTCDTNAIATEAQAAASAAGYEPDAYAHLVYAFPLNLACGWWGLSSVGGDPSETWVSGEFELGVTAHELGHAMGLFHSHSLDCGSESLGGTCVQYEYGDTVDMMGSSSFAHYNAFQKERLGWLNAGGDSPPILEVQSDGSYRIDAYEMGGLGPKALKILKSTDPETGQKTWYYVMARQAIGFDAPLADNLNVLNGVLILTGTEGNGNSGYLLDMTPESGSSQYWDWKDPALEVGQSFTDPETGLTIIADWTTDTEAQVTIWHGEGGSGFTAPQVVLATSQSEYTVNDTVYITAEVTSDGSPAASTAVAFTITKADGSIVDQDVTTASNGMAVCSLRIKRQDPSGSYTVEATATVDGLSGSASNSFTVR